MLCQAVIALPPHRIVLPVRCMDCSFLYVQRGLTQRFGDGGMTMNGRDQFIHRGLQPDGQRTLGNEVCGPWPNDMHAQNFAVFRSGDELYQTLSAIEDQRLSVGTHGELTHLVCDALGLALLLRESHRGSLRLNIDAGGVGGFIIVRFMAADILCRHLAHGGSSVRKLSILRYVLRGGKEDICRARNH